MYCVVIILLFTSLRYYFWRKRAARIFGADGPVCRNALWLVDAPLNPRCCRFGIRNHSSPGAFVCNRFARIYGESQNGLTYRFNVIFCHVGDGPVRLNDRTVRNRTRSNPLPASCLSITILMSERPLSFLKNAGYVFWGAATPEEAMSRLVSHPVEVVLHDLNFAKRATAARWAWNAYTILCATICAPGRYGDRAKRP